MKLKFLVIGLGSMGKRRIRNLISLDIILLMVLILERIDVRRQINYMVLKPIILLKKL